MAQPNIDAFFDQLTGRYGWDFGAMTVNPGFASGIVSGTNPPWTAADFFVFYPKFGGIPQVIAGTLANGSASVSVANTAGLAAGQLIVGAGVPTGTVISSVGDTALVLSQNATGAGSTTLSIYTNPILPLVVVNAYIALASASLVHARWVDSWAIAMGLYVAHFCTLWMDSDGDAYSTPGQAAVAGLSHGIAVSSSAGPVSESSQLVPGLEAWGSWTETKYGTRLATMAKSVGAGPIWIY